MALISVPLTNLGLHGLRGRDMAQGAALNNMMRQLGGSFGIAFVNTYVAHRMATHRVDLISHISLFDPATQQRLSGMIGGMMAKGMAYATAVQQAYAMLEGTVMRQMMLLSYLDVFNLVALFFVGCIPLIMIVRRKDPPPQPEASAPTQQEKEEELEAMAAH